MILIPLAFGLARKTKKSTLYYVIPLLSGLATGFAFIPPSAGSVLVANMLNVNLGVMITVGVPVGILSLIFAGILWSKFIGSRIDTGLSLNIQEVREEEEGNLPAFSTVLCIILVPLVLTESSKSPASIAKSNKQWVGTYLYQEGYKPLLINCEAVIRL